MKKLGRQFVQSGLWMKTMASLDHFDSAPKRVHSLNITIESVYVVLFVVVLLGLIGGVIVGGLITLLFGSLPGWLWTAIIGCEILAAFFVIGATRVAKQ